MWKYLTRRVLYMLPTLLGVNLLVFGMFFVVNSPDDMARQFLGDKASSPEQIQRWKSSRGYDLPLWFNHQAEGLAKFHRTIFWTKGLAMFRGDFGASDQTGIPISRELRRRIPPTFALALPMFLGTLLVNVVLAMKLAACRGRWVDRAGQFLLVVVMSVSTLIFIIVGQYAVAHWMRLVPVSGFEYGWQMVKYLLLPTAVGILAGVGSGTRLYRTFFLEQLNQDYVRTARAKGVGENSVLFRHVLRNALLPILTGIPANLLMLFTGNMMLEKFFNIPGVGGFTIDAIAAQDFAIVRTMVFLGAVIYAVGVLLADLAYAWADPRIRY